MQAGGHRFEPVRLHPRRNAGCGVKRRLLHATAETLVSAKAERPCRPVCLDWLFSSQRRSEIGCALPGTPNGGGQCLAVASCWALWACGRVCVLYYCKSGSGASLGASFGSLLTFRRCSTLAGCEACWGIAKSDRQAGSFGDLAA